MNMVGAPKHAISAAKLGADLVCAQGGEAGGHTGDIPTIVLVPAVRAAVEGIESLFTKQQVQVVAAGGLYNGHSLAAALMLGANAVWIGTRFILLEESGSSKAHKEFVHEVSHGEILFSGRPLNSRATPYLRKWEDERKAEQKRLLSKAIIPVQSDLENRPDDDEVLKCSFPQLMGKVAAMVDKELPAKQIVDEMVDHEAELLKSTPSLLVAEKL